MSVDCDPSMVSERKCLLTQEEVTLGYFILLTIIFFTIYLVDFIDTGNYKKALQEADKVLKKQKDFSCAKVLKSLALLRLNRTSDANLLLDEVRSTNPTEDATLQAITTFYRDTNQPHMIVDMYEKAVAKDPSNEELLSHLFMSYVRLGDYKKQQLVALNLYKLKPKNPYYFWSVVSLYLQAMNTSDSADTPANTKSLLLKLAEKKVEKFIAESKIEAEAEVELFLMILGAQEKYSEMLNAMEGPLGKFIRSVPFLAHRKAVLHRKIGQNEAAFHLIQNNLDIHPDQLSYYLELIELAIELDCERKEVRHLSHVLDLLNGQILRHAKNKVRGPYIAKIELKYQIESSAEINFDISSIISSIGPIAKLIDEMYTEFGHKMPFYLDLGYLASKYPKFISECASWFNSLDSPLKSYDANVSSEDEMRRNYILLLLDHHLNESHRTLESFGKLVHLYSSNLKYGQGLPMSDINPSDFYALIAISCVIEQLTNDDGDEDILSLINLCYKCLGASPSNHTIRLLLVFLLNSVGAVIEASKLFKALDTKYIQMDTLDYIVSRSIQSLGQISFSNAFHKSSGKFYSRTCRDTNDFTISCYKFGSFGKISEINSVRSRIKNSLQHTVVRVDRLFSSLMLEGPSEQLTVSTLYSNVKGVVSGLPTHDELVDNRDLRTFGVLPIHIQNELDEWKDYSFQLESHWYILRGLMLESIVLVYELSENKGSENASKLSTLMDKIKFHKGESGKISYKRIRVQPYIPRVISFVDGKFVDILVNFLDRLCLLFHSNGQLKNDEDLVKKESNGITSSLFDDTVKMLNELLENTIKFESKLSLKNVNCILEQLVNFTEVITLIIYLIWIVSYKKISTTGGIISNKGKKKSTSSNCTAFSSIVKFAMNVKDILNKLISHMKNISTEDQLPTDRLGPFIGQAFNSNVSFHFLSLLNLQN